MENLTQITNITPRRASRWLRRLLDGLWDLIVGGLLVNIAANAVSLRDILGWIVNNPVPSILLLIAFGTLTGFVRVVNPVPAPQRARAWLIQMLRYGTMIGLLLIVVWSFWIPLSTSTVAITMIPLAVISFILFAIRVYTLLLPLLLPSQSQLRQSPPSAVNISRRLILFHTLFTGGVVVTLTPLSERLLGLLKLLFPPPTFVTLSYSTEKEEWLKDAVDRFNQQQQSIQVILANQHGSLDVDTILAGKSELPTIWSPASSLALHLLSTKWQQKYPDRQEIIAYTDPAALQYVVHSPLVFAIWQSRANILSNVMVASPPYNAIDWPNIHNILLKNWSDIHGDSSWGEIKFGQTQPDLSNSGLLTITLIAYAYFSNKESGLDPADVTDPQFEKFFNDIENKVWCFGPSTGTFMNTVIQRGPSGFDIITTYENLVLTREPEATSRHEPLLMFYPSLNIISDHPFAILQGDWLKPAQRDAALQFLNFLSSLDQQKLALTFGFRPFNVNVKITDPISGNRFQGQPTFLQSQIKSEADLHPLAQTPSSETIDALVTLWQKHDYRTRAC